MEKEFSFNCLGVIWGFHVIIFDIFSSLSYSGKTFSYSSLDKCFSLKILKIEKQVIAQEAKQTTRSIEIEGDRDFYPLWLLPWGVGEGATAFKDFT